jgi:hypothetical protein
MQDNGHSRAINARIRDNGICDTPINIGGCGGRSDLRFGVQRHGSGAYLRLSRNFGCGGNLQGGGLHGEHFRVMFMQPEEITSDNGKYQQADHNGFACRCFHPIKYSYHFSISPFGCGV